MPSRLKTVLLALPCLLLLADCAQNPVSGRQDFVMMSEAQEVNVGNQADREVKQQYALYNVNELAKYVEQVGQKLAKQSHRGGLEYRFTLLDSAEVNAFALPGGHVYITRGILAYLNSEAELAGVLGHEIGHVTARHSVRQMSAAQGADIALTIASIFSPALRNQSVQSVSNILGNALLSGYGREHELEADRLGAEYLSRVGYDTQAMIKVVGVLKNQELFDADVARQEGRQPRPYHGLFATHPDNDTRLKQVIAEATQRGGARVDDGAAAFRAQTAGMVFGDNAQQGVIRAGSFYHEELGLALKLPEGWRIANQPDKLAMSGPGDEARLEMASQKRPNVTPQDLVARTLRGGAGEMDVTPVNGLPAAIGISRGRFFAAIYQGDYAYLFSGAARTPELMPRHQEAMRASVKSFHALTDAERKLAKPLVIRHVTATAATRFADLAKNSPLGRNAEGYLRLINAMYPAGEPTAGQTVKVIE
jgi:predicted Zn-dependent protease